ncbi:UbiA-like polyprenyltransferase [Granulicella tundricola]|uniref:4-hydroxybenzoate polyprenyltransferase n=1 Tax=Granulicella tundricola (strain ATCC BAA-1859 / DSM 23138 / MP5ACTX9) TaxID=1198114 RepID=E8WWK1_GRATM|nr:UbiA-like polyprenyltransferase [Granulicella tundricola]ADW69665.1 4-hydroxybenzoate polyprenyltransferase [Granulicella tundricola MP5ACTX9]
MASLVRNTAVTLEMIKWEHSIFALPFALTGAVLAAGGWPPAVKLLWIVVCMVAARSAAMAFNRLVDATLDEANPRTKMRAIPAGQLSWGFVAGFVVVSSAVFLVAAAMLNRLTLELAPVALVVVLAYSYMKRLTRWSHLVLGLALGIAPSAAWIAVTGSLDPRIIVLTGLVMLWVGGFDVLYACQDFEHDRAVGLNSVPAAFGLEGAFWIARVMHLGVVGLAIWLDRLFGLGVVGYVGTAIVAGLLVYEHCIISPRDLRRMNAAFFLLNGIISVVFFLFVAGAVVVRR